MSLAARMFKVILGSVVKLTQLLPDGAPDPLSTEKGEIGRSRDRLDGPAKVAGDIRYTADEHLAHMTYAVAVGSTIARGRILALGTEQAAGSPGVLLVMTHENAPRMMPTPAYATIRGPIAAAGTSLPILNTDEVFWNGQPIAVVVAETLEQAQCAARLVRAQYEPAAAALALSSEKPRAFTPSQALLEEADLRIGDVDTALERAAITTDQVYTTPLEYQNPIEPHATLAVWEDGDLIVYDATQYPYGVKEMLAKKFGLPKQRVRVLGPFVGGGFGSKTAAWPHVSLAVAAAKLVNRPVKLVLSRADMFYMTGGRSPTESRVALGADAEGRLTALVHEALSICTRDVWAEAAILPSRHLYACPNIRSHQQLVRLDRIQNAFFRAPGAAPGSFALESAIDELAWQLQIDPLELRLRNEPDEDPTRSGIAFSSRYLRDAYAIGAEAFSWSRRPVAPRAIRDGRWLVGQGMAAAMLPVVSIIAAVKLRLEGNGSVTIECSNNELGAGTSTAQSQVAAQRLGLPFEKIRFIHGDSNVSETRLPGASAATTTIADAVHAACDTLVRKLLALVRGTDSPLANCRYSDVEARDEGLFLKQVREIGETYQQILARAGRDALEVSGKAGLPYQVLKRSMHAYGAQFCEVRVDEDTGEVRVSRWVGAFDGGRILNPKQACSQMSGGIIMGIGMALSEQTLLDERSGRIANRSLAEYHVPTNADVPEINVHFVDRPDPLTPVGAKGIGELGIVGVAAAIANAVYHATGKRVRELPITLDKLL
jgi:xanthine dehydrogenase YagR molybdenum-binding subunit